MQLRAMRALSLRVACECPHHTDPDFVIQPPKNVICIHCRVEIDPETHSCDEAA